MRSRGDGTRYNNENSSWSDGVNATTLSPPDDKYAGGYAEDGPASDFHGDRANVLCENFIARRKGYEDKTVELEDGSIHVARLEIWVDDRHASGGCVEAIVHSISKPGATKLSWKSEVHIVRPTVLAAKIEENVGKFAAALKNENMGQLGAFFRLDPPGRGSATTETPVSYACTKCVGGSLSHTRYTYDRYHVLPRSYYFYGSHSFVYGSVSWKELTEANWMSPRRELAAGESFADKVLGELGDARELSDSIRAEISDLIEQQGGTN